MIKATQMAMLSVVKELKSIERLRKFHDEELQQLLIKTQRKFKRNSQSSSESLKKPFRTVYIKWERFRKKEDGCRIELTEENKVRQHDT